MILQRSSHPGSHERHLLRKTANPLFTGHPVTLSDTRLLEAQGLDHDLLLAFTAQFRQLLEQANRLEANVESDTILTLKAQLDHAYEMAAGVADDQTDTKQAIRHLLQTLMLAVRQGAGADAQAHRELDDEEAAREAHFGLLEATLVADLLNPESVIQPHELLPTLLSTDSEDLRLAVQLFDSSQLEILIAQGVQLLEQLPHGANPAKADAEQKLLLIQGYAEFLRSTAR